MVSSRRNHWGYCRTRHDIAKLPTPECDTEENKEAWRDPNQWVTELSVSWGKARSLEQQRDAAVMALNDCAVELREIVARDGVPYTHEGVKSSVDEDYFRSVAVNAIETLQAIKDRT